MAASKNTIDVFSLTSKVSLQEVLAIVMLPNYGFKSTLMQIWKSYHIFEFM